MATRELGPYAVALGPRGVLFLTDVDWETGRPYLESTLEVPYAEVASHVVTGSALSSYLARCPAALAPRAHDPPRHEGAPHPVPVASAEIVRPAFCHSIRI